MKNTTLSLSQRMNIAGNSKPAYFQTSTSWLGHLTSTTQKDRFQFYPAYEPVGPWLVEPLALKANEIDDPIPAPSPAIEMDQEGTGSGVFFVQNPVSAPVSSTSG